MDNEKPDLEKINKIISGLGSGGLSRDDWARRHSGPSPLTSPEEHWRWHYEVDEKNPNVGGRRYGKSNDVALFLASQNLYHNKYESASTRLRKLIKEMERKPKEGNEHDKNDPNDVEKYAETKSWHPPMSKSFPLTYITYRRGVDPSLRTCIQTHRGWEEEEMVKKEIDSQALFLDTLQNTDCESDSVCVNKLIAPID